MDYDTKLWNKYTDDNQKSEQKELSKLIYYTTIMLGGKKVCDAGCNIGNNLSAFPNNQDVHGVDINEYAIEQAKKRYPSFKFNCTSIEQIPYTDSFFDVVFTRGVLIHIPKKNMKAAMDELYRISKKWIFHLEYFGEDGKMIEWKRGKDLLWYRNMKKLWEEYNVEVISDIEIPLEIDSGKSRLTIIKKK